MKINILKCIFLVFMLLLATFIFSSWYLFVSAKSPIIEKMFVKEIQVSSTGFVILTCEEIKNNKKVESLWILNNNELGGKVYSGNVKIKKVSGKYYFEDNNL